MSAPPAASAPVDLALGFVERVRRALRLGWRAAARGVVEFYSSDNLTFAASIAYYALLSFFPFVFLVFSLLSRIAVVQGGETLLHIVERALPSRFTFVTDQIESSWRRLPSRWAWPARSSPSGPRWACSAR